VTNAARRPTSKVRGAVKSAQSVGAATATLTVDPQLGWREGILRGTVGATSRDDLVFTLVSGPSLGGKLGSDTNTNKVLFGPAGQFSYLPYATTVTDAGSTETFAIMVAENTRFDQALTSIPLIGLLAQQALLVLHRTPILGDLLAPIIGAAEVVNFTVTPSAEAAGRPIAFTYLMPSFDGTPISINYYPATDVANGTAPFAPTVLNGPGLPGPGNTDPDNPLGQQLSAATQFGSLTPGIPVLRDDAWSSPDGGPSYDGGGGYNVVSFDPRGEYASGGVLQLDNPFYEGRDVSSIITWATSVANPARNQVQIDLAGDPLIGMVGGSYGGGIQLTAASTDPRIDAIVPQLAWNSLISSLYPNTNQFKTGLGSGLLIALAITGATINNQIYAGVLTGLTLGWLSQTSQALLSSSGPTSLLEQLRAPTLLFQGMEDVLFPLQEALTNAQSILANPYGPEVKMVWFCGGHGTCLSPLNPYQDDLGLIDNLKWLDQYVAADPDRPADTIPAFQWYDQNGDYRSSTLLPFQDGFDLPLPYSARGAGGLLGIVPALGGSGPAPLSDLPFSIGNGAPAWNALNTNVTPPPGDQIVGAPAIAFRYTGVGTSRTVYAQLVDNITGRVLGNIVTPIPVTLDGREHTVSIAMENIAYTVGAGDSLTLQITSSASGFENFTSFGVVHISDIELDLPIRAGL
jgi:ABC-2 type transport system ATP-binding protein